MTIDTILPPAPSTRARRPTPARKAAPDRRRGHRRINISRRRRTRFENLPPPIDPSAALAELMRIGDFYMVGKAPYLVVPLSDELLDALITAAGRDENDEENGDHETSIEGSGHGRNDHDLESDGLEDEALNWDREGGEMTLGWANEGSQEHLHGSADESELSLGWNNNGMHLQLVAGYSGGADLESDGNCDDEPDVDDEPDHEDDGVIDGDGSTPWSVAI